MNNGPNIRAFLFRIKIMKTIKYTILLLFLFSCSTLNRKIASEHKYLRDCNEALGNMMTGYYRYARDFDEMMKRYVPVEGDNRKQFFERNGQISWSYGCLLYTSPSPRDV